MYKDVFEFDLEKLRKDDYWTVKHKSLDSELYQT
jgi:hypothetical protein